MVYQTYRLLLHDFPPFSVTAFVFFATMCSYNFHWYLTPDSVDFSRRIQWAREHKGWHLILYFMGLTGTIICFFPIRTHWMALGFVAFITFLYSAPKLPQDFFRALKKIAIGKTLFLAIVWTHVTTLLPVFISGESLKPAFIVFALSRFGLIYAICILFDYRDREDDKKDGILSMITYFNEQGINVIFWCSLIISFLAAIAMYAYGFSTTIVLLMLIPGVITASLFNYAKRNFSDYLYYFVLDGLMMLSGLLMLIGRIDYF
jgi:1,4-dihydroxy-2-naphthoate octaprenyltransferase